ncbi:MAG: hypothetical protein R3F61_30850 [Myxococcota bacterium]
MLIALALSCVNDTWEPPEYPPVQAGAPVVGAAEGFLKLPVGTPLGGFTNRCTCLGGDLFKPDDRKSNYTTRFTPSGGVHTHPLIKVIWIENGDEHLVITKTDTIYSYDGLVEDLEKRLGEATGLDLDGRVIHTANHSHNSYGDFSDQITFYLGSDKYNEEIFQRFSSQVADVALEAFESRVEAKIGLNLAQDWDPDDRVYRDRRGENDDLVVGGDDPFPTGKDPQLALMRFDTLNDDPIAVMVNFGMHGTLLDIDNTMISTDSGGGIESYLQEAFDDEVVVMFTQGSGGDQSPAGEQDPFAHIESVGERATPLLMDVWESTPTSADALRIQTAARAIPEHPTQIHVTRNGTVDWRYTPYDAEGVADNVVYDASGEIVSPIDEFNTTYGSVFCGTGDLDLPVGRLPGVDAYPYTNCLEVELMGRLISVFFDIDPDLYGLDIQNEEFLPLPIPDTLKANTTASRWEGLLVTTPEGSGPEDVLFGFFPGEATHMFNEQFRRRTKAELGVDHGVMISYAQDHEGYMLIPEDWLVGGYEPDIAVWGPLQAEHVMERTLEYSAELLFDDVHQPSDPLNQYQPTSYPVRPLPELAPDLTPTAGMRVAVPPESLYAPAPFVVDLTMPAQVPRVQGLVQLAWMGGDPGVDEPVITLERMEGGSWTPVTSHSGRPISDSTHDILKTHTPDPLFPASAQQDHYWWAAWQAVGHVRDRAGLPLGTYRLHVEGKHFAGGSTTWPWAFETYTLDSEPFELVPGEIDIEVGGAGLVVSLPSPEDGYRYVAAGGNDKGDNPVPGELTVVWSTPAGDVSETITGTPTGNRTELAVSEPVDATAVTVTDVYGNTGTLSLLPPV